MKPIVLIGTGSTCNKYHWSNAVYDVYLSNMAWRSYYGPYKYVVVADEHWDYVNDKMKKAKGKNKERLDLYQPELIRIDEEFVHKYETIRTGSFQAFFHMMLITNVNRKFIIQGIDYDDRSRNWDRYARHMNREILRARPNGNKIYTTSGNRSRLVNDGYI